jgi:arylsulfatase A-like enzyme
MPFRRNLLIILTHGLRADALGDAQAWPLRTPALEKLAQRGACLIAGSACPADPGGMVSLLTGLHVRQHGYFDQAPGPAACEGFPAQLADAGYHVVGVGQVGAIEPWLDEAILVEDVEQADSARCQYLTAMRAKGFRAAIQQQRRQRQRYGPFEPDRLLLEPDDDVDGFIAVEARRAMERLPRDKPWALIVIFSGPGNDLPPPVLYDGLIEPELLTDGFTPADFTQVDALAELDFPRVLLQRLEPGKIGRIRADYLGRVSLIDHGLGRLMASVEERPDASRIWTLLASDRGCLLGEHGLIGHRSFLAGAIEVPILIVPPAPGRAAPQEFHDGLISTVDLAATLAALAGCDSPRASAGRSLLPALSGEPVLPVLGGGIISEFGPRLMLETERYRVIFHAELQRAIALYDLLFDPDERENLIELPTGRNVLDALRWRLGDALLPLRARPN